MHHLSRQGSVWPYVVSSKCGWKEEKEEGEFDLYLEVLAAARLAELQA